MNVTVDDPTEHPFPPHITRSFFDHSAIGMYVSDMEGTFLHVNTTLCKMLGRREDELRRLRWMDVVHPEHVERFGDWQTTVLSVPNWRGEVNLLKADGTNVSTLLLISVIRDADGTPVCLFAQVIDKDRFREFTGFIPADPTMTVAILSALDSLGEGVMIIDPRTRTPLFVNEALTRMNGYTLSDLEALPGGIFGTLDPPDATKLQDRLKRRLAGEDVPNHYEVELYRKDGRRIRIETAVQLIPGEPDLLVAIVRDVTERKRTQEQDQRTERINAMGRMAAGTAHDFNNLLTSILGEADLLLDSLDTDQGEWGEIRRGIEDIKETAELAARLAKRLLDIGTPRALMVASTDLKEIIEKMEPVLLRVISDNTRLETELCDPGCHARLFPDELEQVVLNLVLNASDALPEGGMIKIEACRTPEERIEVTVADDGPGIPPEVQASMFEPYFTTKKSGRGTGLGLSVVDAIVTRSDGNIKVETAPGRGTRVTVSFPAVQPGDGDRS